ncbi:MAG: hypothetical protein LBR36_00630 [Bacteroidales bacterium]|nr:hypothetical protein [Bacteroidales bacterium]
MDIFKQVISKVKGSPKEDNDEFEQEMGNEMEHTNINATDAAKARNDKEDNTIAEDLPIRKGSLYFYDTKHDYGMILADTGEYYRCKISQKNVFVRANMRPGLEADFTVFFFQRPDGKVSARFQSLRFPELTVHGEQVFEEFEQNSVCKGVLEYFEKQYFVKHIPTGLKIPVEVHRREVGIEEVYKNRIGQEVSFELKPNKKNKLIALLIDRKPKPTKESLLQENPFLYEAATTKRPLEAVVLNPNVGKARCILCQLVEDNTVKGFIYKRSKKPEVQEKLDNLQIGDTFFVQLHHVPKKNKICSFKLAEKSGENTEEIEN